MFIAYNLRLIGNILTHNQLKEYLRILVFLFLNKICLVWLQDSNFKTPFTRIPVIDIQIPWLPDSGLNKLNLVLNEKVIRQTPVMCNLDCTTRTKSHRTFWHIWFYTTHKPTLRKTKRAKIFPAKYFINNRLTETIYLINFVA